MNCAKCEKRIYQGKAFYDIRIEIKSGFNGVIPEENWKNIEEELKSYAKIYTEEELEKQVYRVIEFSLCPRCTEIFIANPLCKPLNGLNLEEAI